MSLSGFHQHGQWVISQHQKLICSALSEAFNAEGTVLYLNELVSVEKPAENWAYVFDIRTVDGATYDSIEMVRTMVKESEGNGCTMRIYITGDSLFRKSLVSMFTEVECRRTNVHFVSDLYTAVVLATSNGFCQDPEALLQTLEQQAFTS